MMSLNPLQPQKSNAEIYRYLTLFSQIGLVVVSALLVCFFGFLWLDRVLHTGGVLMVVGIVVGVAAGFLAAYRLIARFFRDNNIEKRSND
jgi:ATP synthase protein I